MEWVEAGGKTLAEAKEIALDHLGVAEDDAEFVVLSEPRAGLFGRQRGEARVKARVRPVAPPPKRARRQRTDRRRDGSSAQRNGSGRSNRGTRGANGGTRERAGSNGGRGNQPQSERSGSRQGRAESEGSVATAEGSGGSGGSGRSRRRSRGGRGGAGQDGGRREGGEKSAGTAGESEDTMEESLTLAQQGEAAKDFVEGLVREFGLRAEVTYEEIDDETVLVAAAGEDLGLLVGPRGATLAAVQDLTRTFVQRQSETRTDRILVDVGGYREKRAAALRRFTEGIVEEVRTSGVERALEPMSPPDRKVIHDAVNEMDDVETRSEGVEPDRYVVIQPAG